MHTISLGYVKVATPGTPVLLSTILAALNLAPELTNNGKVHKLELWPLLSNVGVTYVGRSATARDAGGVVVNKATGVGVFKQVQIPSSSGHQDFFKVESFNEENTVVISDYAVDAASANDGFAVFVQVL